MKLAVLTFLCSLAAAFLFAVQTERIIFNNPVAPYAAHKNTQTASCTLYWHDRLLQPETKLIVCTDDAQQNLLYLINTWLLFLYSEDMHKKVHAETVTLSPSGNELFISFDRRPFGKQQSIDEKIGFIHNLFKTIRPHTAARKVRFLVRHAPLHDTHLDFTFGWDIDGY